MMRNPSITNELRQHREGTRGQGLVDERLLSRKGLYGRAAGQLISAGICVDDFGVEFGNRAKSSRLAAVLSIQWLTQNILSACGVIANVKPVGGSLAGRGQGFVDRLASCAGVYTADDKVRSLS
jgi:hypothetical protein